MTIINEEARATNPRTSALTPSSVFRAQYTMVRSIGSLHNGGVSEARMNRNGKHVAVKYYNTTEFPAGKSTLAWEARVMSEVGNHPNVVGAHSTIFTEDSAHLVMDLCDGDMYAATEEPGAMPLVCVKSVFGQMLAGVRHCHSLGYAHRDVKFENFFIKYASGASPSDLFRPDTLDRCQILLGDFGFAVYSRDCAGGTLTQTVTCGSDIYGAPEQTLAGVCGPEGYNPEAADVFSLGVCLFFLYFGFPPWETNQSVSDAYAHLWALGNTQSFWSIIEYHTGNEAPAEFKALFTAMCAIDPAERPTLNQVALHPFLTGEEENEYTFTPRTSARNDGLSRRILAAMSAPATLPSK